MKWNWQQPEWPNFCWDSDALADLESQFLTQSGIVIGSVKHLGEDDRASLTIDVMTGEALKTSEIEGEMLNRDSVQSSLRRQFGLDTDHRRVPPAERGIADMMVALYRGYAEPLSDDNLFAWHQMLLNGQQNVRAIGHYRDHDDPMQVVSGALHKPKVHFEAPPSSAMTAEMRKFFAWFSASALDGTRPLPALTRAGIAHLYFVSIHPFEDGNGRIARALAEKVLSQAIGQPSLIALSHIIQKKRSAYYDALEAANKGNEVTAWLSYFAATILDAQRHSLALIDFLLTKTRFYDRFRQRLNERQAKVIARMFREGLDGFRGGLSASNYISITETSRATATRDLHALAAMGAFTSSGALKSTRYHLSLDHYVRFTF